MASASGAPYYTDTSFHDHDGSAEDVNGASAVPGTSIASLAPNGDAGVHRGHGGGATAIKTRAELRSNDVRGHDVETTQAQAGFGRGKRKRAPPVVQTPYYADEVTDATTQDGPRNSRKRRRSLVHEHGSADAAAISQQQAHKSSGSQQQETPDTQHSYFIASYNSERADDATTPEHGSVGLSLNSARSAGIYSAAALFRAPSARAKKYTRPPMSRLFSSLCLSPENFLRLQSLAKAYMLDPTQPDRQACVGNRGKGDGDIVKLRLYSCVREFLDEGGTGEIFFGEGSEGSERRGWIWPRDANEVVTRVMPLLRRMVTNERQRQYAVETRSGKRVAEDGEGEDENEAGDDAVDSSVGVAGPKKQSRRKTRKARPSQSAANENLASEVSEDDLAATNAAALSNNVDMSSLEAAAALQQWKGQQLQRAQAVPPQARMTTTVDTDAPLDPQLAQTATLAAAHQPGTVVQGLPGVEELSAEETMLQVACIDQSTRQVLTSFSIAPTMLRTASAALEGSGTTASRETKLLVTLQRTARERSRGKKADGTELESLTAIVEAHTLEGMKSLEKDADLLAAMRDARASAWTMVLGGLRVLVTLP